MPNRKALCIGCNYVGSKMTLNGCVNDCADNVQLCVKQLGVPANQIMVLADAEVPGVKGASPPTKQNILSAIKRLVSGAQPGDLLYMSYSGHGTQVVDRSGEEEDGMDEAIVPTDYDQTGRVITDDELFAYLVEPLPEGVLLSCIFDCCHAGTILDLDSVADGTSMDKRKAGKTKYTKNKKGTRDLKAEFEGVGEPRAIPAIMDYVPDTIPEPMCQARGGGGGPTVFCISGCRDDQTSLDVTLGGKPCGALTNCLMKELRTNGGIGGDYQTVFRNTLANMDNLRSSIPRMTQRPQMSYNDVACPSGVAFCKPSANGQYAPAYPSPSQDVTPHNPKKDKKEKKDKGDKDKKEKKEKPVKEKKEKPVKEKKDKGKKGKSRGLQIIDDGFSSGSDDSDDEQRRMGEYGKHVLAAALGGFR